MSMRMSMMRMVMIMVKMMAIMTATVAVALGGRICAVRRGGGRRGNARGIAAGRSLLHRGGGGS